MGLVKHETLLLTLQFFSNKKKLKSTSVLLFLVCFLDWFCFYFFDFVCHGNQTWIENITKDIKNKDTNSESFQCIFIENRMKLIRVFKIKRISKKIQYVIKNGKCYEWQQISEKKSFDFDLLIFVDVLSRQTSFSINFSCWCKIWET